ncbi:MAG TPA: hypothetical protein VHK64_05985 [Nocardioidaceae bacterium]|jgi:hypothetical protein|nr:hypothetical protein [Nocardioidaceae bacterium]
MPDEQVHFVWCDHDHQPNPETDDWHAGCPPPITPVRYVHWWWYEQVNFCGCGNPEDVLQTVKDALQLTHHGRSLPTTSPWDMLAYQLDAWELTEHGTTLAGAWLTDDGRRLLDALEAVSDLELPHEPDRWEAAGA